MADTKTHLRELSPLLAFDKSIDLNSQITPNIFVTSIRKNFPYISAIPQNISNKDSFSSVESAIINRGMRLGQNLIEKFGFTNSSKVMWIGNDTHSTMPIDLVIDGLKFSLKEESFILENMGLYKYINLITGAKVERGQSHIFRDYAKAEYDEWFNSSWNILIKDQIEWRYNTDKYTSEIIVNDSTVEFIYKDIKSILPRENNIGIDKYMEMTSPKTREKVYAKWIKDKIESHPTYLKYKKNCSIRAGERLVSFLKDNQDFDNENILRLLQIYEEGYYYAKVTDNGPSIYKIPSKDEYLRSIIIKDIISSVPKSQLNIITTILNTKTQGELILRNEIRFSHGQFNGTPEAKMYYDRSSDLSVIYFPV